MPAAATYRGSDAATRGSWKGVYGSDGYDLAGDAETLFPAYVVPVPSPGAGISSWSSSTTDSRALQKVSNLATDRIAAAWFTFGSMTIDVDLTDGLSHAVSLYVLDFDNFARVQTIQVVDPSDGSILDSQDLEFFNGGRYLTWELTGHVQFAVTMLPGNPANAVVSGIFFGAPNLMAASATVRPHDLATAWSSPPAIAGGNSTAVIGSADASLYAIAVRPPDPLPRTFAAAVATSPAVATGDPGPMLPGAFATAMGAVAIAVDANGLAYFLFSNDGAGGPIDYDSVIAVVDGTSWVTPPLASGSAWSFGVRSFQPSTQLAERNLDAAVTIRLADDGVDRSATPSPATLVTALPAIPGGLRVTWFYPLALARRVKVSGFKVYVGTPTADFAAAAATIAYTGPGSYSATIAGLTGGSACQVVVRAYNAAGDDGSTAGAIATPLGSGPDPVSGLTATLTNLGD